MTHRSVLLNATCLMAFCGFAAPAWAEGDSSPEIVVTATITDDTANLQDTPDNVQLLKSDALTRQNPTNLADLLNANVGSVTISNGTGSPYQNDVSYRGFQATSLLGSPTGLSTYLDGVRMNEPFGANLNWDLIPLNAVSQVEILPGSNPLFGLNTLGGSLVLTTKNGADNGGLAVTAQAGSWNHYAISAEAGGTNKSKSLDWFISGNYDKQDGYRWYTDTLVKQAYGKVRWHGANANLELSSVWAQSMLNGTQGLPVSMLSTPWMAYTWPDNVANKQFILNLKGDVRLSKSVKISGNGYYRSSSATSANSNASLDDGCSDAGTTTNCAGQAPNGTALDLYTNNPGLPGTSKYNSFVPYTGSLPIADYTDTINTSMADSTLHQDIWGGNLLLDIDSKIAGISNDLNFGGSLEISRIHYTQDTWLAYLVNYQTVYQPWNYRYGSAAGFEGSPLMNSLVDTANTTSYNLFVRDALKLTPTLTITGSLSYTGTRVSQYGASYQYLNDDGGYSWTDDNTGAKYYNPAYVGSQYWSKGALVTATAKGTAGPESWPISGTNSWHRLNPSVGLAWNPVKSLGIFANYSEAMRAPTAIELACANPETPCALPTGFNGDPYLPKVVAHTLEAGARGQIARHFNWNAALYRTILDNDIEFDYTPSGLGYFTNVGKTERKGFELGASADFQRFHLSASYGYVSATYRSSFLDANGDTVVPGDHITGIPSQSFKLRAVVMPIRQVLLGANLIVTSSQYAHGDEANLNGAVPGYALVNLDAHVYPLPRTEVFANITNLLNKQYATYGVMGQNLYTGNNEQFLTPAPGRGFMVGLRYALGKAGGASDKD